MIEWKLIKQIWTLTYFCYFIERTCSLTIDNELVSARNDCFERVALEAMIPFEKTFNTEDTNSLRMCKEKCLQAGDKCQSMSFGVHRRGNGTCQLSKEKYKIGSRPNGVIFDPDFDLYSRKTNCFDLMDNNLQDQSDNLQQTNGFGLNVAHTTQVLLPSRPSSADTPILVVEPSPTIMTSLQDESTRFTGPTVGYGQSPDSSVVLTPGPPVTYEPSSQNMPSAQPAPGANTDHLYFSHDIYPLYKYPTLYESNYPAPNQEVYIPGGYAANAQAVVEHYRPSSYDSHVMKPSSSSSNHEPPKPIFGLGYGTGYGYGPPEAYNPTNMQPQQSLYSFNNNMNRDSRRPASGYEQHNNRDPYRLSSYDKDRDTLRPSSSGHDNTTPSNGYFPQPNNVIGSVSPYGSIPSNDHNSVPPNPFNEHNALPAYAPRPGHDQNSAANYQPRPENSVSSPPTNYGPNRPALQRPSDFIDYTNRPDVPDGLANPTSTYSPSFDSNYMRRNGTAASKPAATNDGGSGGGYNDDRNINTYFNPDDYLMGIKKRPEYYEGNKRPAYNRGPMKGKTLFITELYHNSKCCIN